MARCRKITGLDIRFLRHETARRKPSGYFVTASTSAPPEQRPREEGCQIPQRVGGLEQECVKSQLAVRTANGHCYSQRRVG
jgi:hypothetical protein